VSATLHDAYELARLGYRLTVAYVPTEDGCSCKNPQCSKPGKHPVGGYKNSTDDPKVIRGWERKYPNGFNIGIDLEASGLVDIAPDSPEWEADFKRRGLPPTVCYQSGSGAGHTHYLYRRTDDCPITKINKPGEYDLLVNSHALAPPSVNGTGPYTWITKPTAGPRDLPPVPAWAVRMLQEQVTKDPARPSTGAAVDLDADDEDDAPPCPLSDHDLAIWQGKDPKRKPDGGVDRSATLLKIGRVLFDAEVPRRWIVAALRERDHALGYDKYTERGDALKQYGAIIDQLAAQGRSPRVSTSRGTGPETADTIQNPGPSPCSDQVAALQARIDQLEADAAHWKNRAIQAETMVDDLCEIQRDSLTLRRNKHVKTVEPTVQALAFELASPVGMANANPDGSVTVRRAVLAENAGRSKDTVTEHLDWLHHQGLIVKETVKIWRPVVDRETGELIDQPSRDIHITLPCRPREWVRHVAAYTPPVGTPAHGGRRVPQDGCHPGATIVRKDHCGTCDRVLGEPEALSRQDGVIEPTTAAPAVGSTPMRQDDVIGARPLKDIPDDSGLKECVICRHIGVYDICPAHDPLPEWLDASESEPFAPGVCPGCGGRGSPRADGRCYGCLLGEAAP
jgi:hypothetical protein